MRFRKLAGLVVGALTVGALAGPGLVAPAHAAPQTTKSFVSENCKFGSFASDYRSDYDVVVDGTDVTVTFASPFSPGFNASPTFSEISPTVVLSVDGQSVTTTGTQTFDPAAPGNSSLQMPVLTGELAEAADGTSVSLTSMKINAHLNVNTGPGGIIPVAGDMVCTQDKLSTLDMDCAANGFHFLYPVEAYTRVSGTAVTTYLRNAPKPGMPAFLSVASQTPTLKLLVNGESVTQTATATYDPPKPGNQPLPLPIVTGTRTGTDAISTVAVEDFDTSLAVAGFGTSAVACSAYDPPVANTTTNTGANQLTCVYNTFVMPYDATMTTSYTYNDIEAELSDVAFNVMPASFKIHSVKATATATANSVPITLTSEVEDFSAAPLAGNASIPLPTLTGTSPSVLIPTTTTLDLITFDMMIVTGFGQNPTVPAAAQIKCALAAATTTTLTATSTTPNAVSLSAAVNKTAAPGKIAFYEGATKIGADVTVAAGVATATVSNVAAGDHTYTAKFTPTEQFRFKASTSPAATAAVSVATTATTLSATSGAPKTVDLAATVAPDTAGTVEFYEGTTKVGQTAAAAGAASLALTGVPAGAHTYTAKFVPTDGAFFGGSTSAPATVTVAVPPACITAQGQVTSATAAVKAATAKVKADTAKVKAAKAKVTKATKAAKKAKGKAKKAKAAKALKAAKAGLKKAQSTLKADTSKLTAANKALTAANNAVKATC